MSGHLIDLQGKSLASPVGLYVAGLCPTCNSPIYYHGGGVDAEGQVHQHLYFPTCLHDFVDVPMKLGVPPQYSFPDERDAVESLFQNLLEMLQHVQSMEERMEFFKSRMVVVPNVEDSGGGESGIPE